MESAYRSSTGHHLFSSALHVRSRGPSHNVRRELERTRPLSRLRNLDYAISTTQSHIASHNCQPPSPRWSWQHAGGTDGALHCVARTRALARLLRACCFRTGNKRSYLLVVLDSVSSRPPRRHPRTKAAPAFASSTLSGVSPPASMNGQVACTSAPMHQSNALPVPPPFESSSTADTRPPRSCDLTSAAETPPSMWTTDHWPAKLRRDIPALGAVELDEVEADALCRRIHLLQRCIDEHAHAERPARPPLAR